MVIGRLIPIMHLAMNPIFYCGLGSQASPPPAGRPLPYIHPTLSPSRVDKGLSEEDSASPQLWPFPTLHWALSHAIGPSSCGLVLRFGSGREFPLDPVHFSPTSLYLNPFVSKIPFGVLCLFFPCSTGNYSECISMCFP